MELHTAAYLSRPAVRAACEQYLQQLGLDRQEQESLLRSPVVSEACSTTDAFVGLHEALALNSAGPAGAVNGTVAAVSADANPAHKPPVDAGQDAAYGSVRHRLAVATRGSRLDGETLTTRDPQGRTHLLSAPPPNRASMAPSQEDRAAPDSPARWSAAATARRVLLGGLVLGQTYLATHFMSTVLPYGGRQPLELAIMVLFAILFGWISVGFWTALAGFALLLSGKDKPAASLVPPRDRLIPAGARTAVIMPICNESVARVFAGLRATYCLLYTSDAADE